MCTLHTLRPEASADYSNYLFGLSEFSHSCLAFALPQLILLLSHITTLSLSGALSLSNFFLSLTY